MKNQSRDRLKIFLALALEHAAANGDFAEVETENPPEAKFEDADESAPSLGESSESGENDEISESPQFEGFPALDAYLSDAEAREFARLAENYRDQTEAEKNNWRADVLSKIGMDEQLLDETIHWSHVNAAVQREIPAVRRIVVESLPPSYKNLIAPPSDKKRKSAASIKINLVSITEKTSERITEKLTEKITEKLKNPPTERLEKALRRAFAGQFIALRDLKAPNWTDRLNGTELARLIRLAGIRETALACMRIEAVESVAAFLHRFPAEDARAIAAQLNNLQEKDQTRLEFAENLVRNTLEIEQQPSALLDLTGINLIGIALSGSSRERIRYTNQKLPIQIVTKLPEIIDEKGRDTPGEIKRMVAAEIEHLAETIIRTGNPGKPGKRRK